MFPPRSNATHSRSSPDAQASSSSSPLSEDDAIATIHKVVEDLKIPVADSIARDDPNKYYYKIQILDEDKSHPTKVTERNKGKESNKPKHTGSLMDVRCADLRCAGPFHLA